MDYLATTPLDPRVLDKMLPYFKEDFGNAASRQHIFGWKAKAAVDHAREQVAASLGAHPEEIYFSSGATESNNLAILGLAESLSHRGKHIITCVTEHLSVLDPCRYLESKGYEVTYLPVDQEGSIDLALLEAEIKETTILISLMSANNEIGTLHPIAEIGKIARKKGVLFHSDASQAAGKIDLNLQEIPIDLLSISGHKIYGPKGIGALYIRKTRPKIKVAPRFYGGGHEDGLRSGTLNVPGIVGLGEALEIATQLQNEESIRIGQLRDLLYKKIKEGIPEVKLNGTIENRLYNNLNLCFTDIHADALMMEMKDIALSSGSACSSDKPKPSHVLLALGLSREAALSSLRFGLGRLTTREEVEYVAEKTVESVKRLRKT